ncbi:16S rRNA (adenine(1518)-N(6)/adenine(1519)-N(6))-dimethyltransferase RsmA [Rickettsiales endosymbiont of Stachyamoeba lipophora]|uniref:16S rRNA (adenine(1518)-N(6)/adenine(1519)-N(6))- dimethyltransferase RsmA n=1 Tax=Rickettsiales endosymbiont of Stachyamoeba lipophora TaxID=2486578 RepID=UPI000F651941|nr:16S rRNA (adenine(1518)-N(6)/adenine(1519)-N(6))-dimethyltransferase RsmA [Rickettsiales endosymbiont of Stachyamoeba lipophora]AZL16124.1 16S rRNA (adenine(1518)-N(6)/adenine(1519)-N(6))-dimethyltransferase RsmA [Rickettsiales endosymbiont of Stachyamoeba lipophora]
MKLNDLPTIAEIVKTNALFADKRFGQNFLFDQNITDKIVRLAGVNSSDVVIEVGPGPGGLTRSILKADPHQLIIIEKDRRFKEVLQQLVSVSKENQLKIIEADALKIDYSQLGAQKFQIIANLPYNIGTVLLFEWLKFLPFLSQITIMLQKEVVDRITATPKTKDYSRISVVIQNYFTATKLFELPPKAFYPPPNVDSAVVKLVPKAPLFDGELKLFESFVQQLFNNRRKQLRKFFENIGINEHDYQSIGITGQARAEELSLEQIVTLMSFVKK